MPAYIIAQVEVSNPTQYAEYQKLAPDAVKKFGGKFIVRGGQTALLEGDWNPKRVVVVQFDSLEKAQAFYQSPEYQRAIAARKGAATMQMLAVEGA